MNLLYNSCYIQVQQPFDPVGYYPQFYRSGGDSDGRISPFHAPKYNGNVPGLSQQTSQSSQEVCIFGLYTLCRLLRCSIFITFYTCLV